MAYSPKWQAEYVSFKGEGHVTVKDHIILSCIEAAAPWWGGLFLTQGGLSTSVAASAGTHAGLGAFDVRTRFNSKAEVWQLASMFLRSGIVFFPRGYNLSTWDPFRNTKHGHCVSRESYDSLHPSAKAQYKEYIAGGDGLVGSAQYTGPSTQFERWATSPYNPANITPDTRLYEVDVSEGFLWGLTVDRVKRVTRDKGETVQAAKQVKRWGRQNVVTADETYYALDYLQETT